MVRLHFALLCLYTTNSLCDLVLENSIYQIASTAAKATPSSLPVSVQQKPFAYEPTLPSNFFPESLWEGETTFDTFQNSTLKEIAKKSVTHLAQLG